MQFVEVFQGGSEYLLGRAKARVGSSDSGVLMKSDDNPGEF